MSKIIISLILLIFLFTSADSFSNDFILRKDSELQIELGENDKGEPCISKGYFKFPEQLKNFQTLEFEIEFKEIYPYGRVCIGVCSPNDKSEFSVNFYRGDMEIGKTEGVRSSIKYISSNGILTTDTIKHSFDKSHIYKFVMQCDNDNKRFKVQIYQNSFDLIWDKEIEFDNPANFSLVFFKVREAKESHIKYDSENNIIHLRGALESKDKYILSAKVVNLKISGGDNNEKLQ